jgi:hypothetical protein
MTTFKIDAAGCGSSFGHGLRLTTTQARSIFYAHDKADLVNFFRSHAGKVLSSHHAIVGYCGKYLKARWARTEEYSGMSLRHNGWMAGMLKMAGVPQGFNLGHLTGSVPDMLQEIGNRLPNVLSTSRFFVGFHIVGKGIGSGAGSTDAAPHFVHEQCKRGVKLILRSRGGGADHRLSFADVADALEHQGWQGLVDLP